MTLKCDEIIIGPPTLVGAGPIRSPSLFILYSLFFISDPFFSETALTIFMKLCTMLDNDKRKKVTKPDYPKKFWIIPKVQKCGQNDSFSTFSQKWL